MRHTFCVTWSNGRGEMEEETWCTTTNKEHIKKLKQMALAATERPEEMREKRSDALSIQPRQLLDGILQRLQLPMRIAAMDFCGFVAGQLHPQLR